MNSIRILVINVLVVALLLSLLEIAVRSAWTVRSCFASTCDYGRLLFEKVRVFPDLSSELSASLRFDSEIGYVPREHFDDTLNTALWRNKRLTITSEGFRENGFQIERSAEDILVVGDSFTFGEQVSNEETWAACLQRTLARRVDNAGVTGYGAAQSLRRAIVELRRRRYADVVLAIVVGDDFSRDRMIYKWGRPKPAVIVGEDGLEWSNVGDPRLEGTIFNPKTPSSVVVALYENSMLFAMVVDRVAPQIVYPWVNFEQQHPDAADLDEIIAWTLRRFSEVTEGRGILLLQYWHLLNDDQMLAERAKILKEATSLSISVVDTYDLLRKQNPELVWVGHHTPHGNELVCRHLADNGFDSVAH